MPMIQIHMLPGTSTLGVPDTAVRAWITEMDPHGFIRAGEIAADQLAAK